MNENTCEARTIERDARGAFVRWRPVIRAQVMVSRDAQDTALTRYELYAFNAKGEQTAEAQCVLRRGNAAKGFMRDFFARAEGTVAVATATLSIAPTAPELPSTPLASIGAGAQCLLDTSSWEMTCGSTVCYPMFAMRVPMRGAREPAVGATEPVGDGTASLTGGWECPGAGSLSLNGNGTLTFHPGGGGEGGGGGGGSGNPCGGGDAGGDNGDGTVNPPGGGGGDQFWWGASCDSAIVDDGSPPDGVAMEDWTGMNAMEKVLCKQSIPKCLSTVLAAKAADAWSQIVEACRPAGSLNGEMDAVRHAYWFADLTARQDTAWAKAWGDAHENYPGNDPLEKAMDLHNNAVGRNIGLLHPTSETDRKAAILAKRDSGLLLKLVNCPSCQMTTTSAPPGGACP